MAPGIIDVGPATGPQVESNPEQAPTSPPSRSNPAHEEYQYLDLIRDIVDHGEHRPDRTGTGTYSIFAPRPMVYKLSRPSSDPSSPESHESVLPLLTTKRVFLRAVIHELLWFISGSTTSVPLSEAGIKIWDGNGSRAYLDSIGLQSRAEGDLGPVYGFQWRHFGAKYVDATTDYSGQGVDQLAEVVRKLKETPWDRRIVLSAWNPKDMSQMALPPCHMFAQFYVSFPSNARRNAPTHTPNGGGVEQKERGVLHTQLYQRSCDMGLGIPFNIASYALLTHMLAYVCDLSPGTLTHVMGDAHVYVDHVEALEEQLKREPRDFPSLDMKPEGEARRRGAGDITGLEGWRVEDFVINGYKPHGKVAMKMSV